MFLNFDTSVVLDAVKIILAVKVIVSSLETFAVAGELKDSGMLSWRTHRLARPDLMKLYQRTGLDGLFKYPAVLGLLGIQLLGSFMLIFFIYQGYQTIFPIVFVMIPSYLLLLRNYQSDDGSDQMATLLILAIFFADASGTEFSRKAVLIFIAAQASLAYGTAGTLKIGQVKWQNGVYIKEILSTSSYGNKTLYDAVTRRKFLAKALTFVAVFGECIAAVPYMFPPVVCCSILFFGLIFHLLIARIMGLNTFIWAFLATYPATLWLSGWLYYFLLA